MKVVFHIKETRQPYRSYIPSKPNPNCLEYYVSVDENYFPTCLRWETPTRYNKYGRPKTMRELMYFFIEHHCQYKPGR